MLPIAAISQQKDIGTIFKFNLNRYSTLADASAAGWLTNNDVVLSVASDGQKCFSIGNGNVQTPNFRSVGSGLQDIKVGAEFKIVGTLASQVNWIALRDQSGESATHTITNNNVPELVRFSTGTVLTTGSALTSNQWYKIELGMFIDNTNGRVRLWKDSAIDTGFTGDTEAGTPAGHAAARFFGDGSFRMKWRKFHVWDRSGI